jgi:hypothetical protein
MDFTAEQRRGNSQRRLLQVLKHLMLGNVLNRHSAAKLLKVNHECAYRILDVLAEELSAVVEVANLSPKTYGFDVEQLRPTGSVRAPNDPRVSVAARFGDAVARALFGTEADSLVFGDFSETAERDAALLEVARRLRAAAAFYEQQVGTRT